MSQPVIVAVAARSGGHLLPCITRAQAIADTIKGRIILVTTTAQLDAHIARQYGLETITLQLDNVPRSALGMIKFLWHLVRACVTCYRLFAREQVHRVVSTGGYCAIPAIVAAWLRGIKRELWELNVEPGKAVKLLQYIAQPVQICFTQTARYLSARTQHVAYPIRFTGNDRLTLSQARYALNLPDKYTVLIVGGSQGSRSLNNHLIAFAKQSLQAQQVQIVHQAGSDAQQQIIDAYKAAGIDALVVGFSDQMHLLYSAADAVICRAGAGAVFESLFFNKRTLLIPLETAATSHQVHNAQAAASENPFLFSYLYERDVTPATLTQFVAEAAPQIPHGAQLSADQLSNQSAPQ